MITSYIFGIILVGIIWFYIYYFFPIVRHEMLIMSFLSGLLFPIHNLYYLKDYWKPQYFFSMFRIEDYLLMFFITGIALALLPVVSKKSDIAFLPSQKILALIIFVINLLIFIPFTFFLNSVYASFIGFAIGIVIGWVARPEFIKESLQSGVLFLIFAIIAYAIFLFVFPQIVPQFWQVEKLSGYFLFRIPIEEHVWDVLYSISIYPIYKIAVGRKYV